MSCCDQRRNFCNAVRQTGGANTARVSSRATISASLMRLDWGRSLGIFARVSSPRISLLRNALLSTIVLIVAWTSAFFSATSCSPTRWSTVLAFCSLRELCVGWARNDRQLTSKDLNIQSQAVAHDEAQDGEDDLHHIQRTGLRLVHYSPDCIAEFVRSFAGT